MYRSKRDVVAGIRERETAKDGKKYRVWTAFLGTDEEGRKVRVARSSREELIKWLGDFYARLKEGGAAAVALTPYEAADARHALDLLAQAGVQRTLTECARAFVDGKVGQAVKPVKIADAIKEYMERDMSELHRRTTKSILGLWMQKFGADRMTDEVTTEAVCEYLKGIDQPKTYNNKRGYLQAFFRWCAKKSRGYMAGDPLEEVEARTVAFRPPEYMPMADVEKVARILEQSEDKSMLACFVLSFFCGIRQEEIKRLAKDPAAGKIDLDNRLITIIKVKGWERGEPPRAFAPMDNAVAWMKSFDFFTALKRVNVETMARMATVAKRAGVKWPKNAGRHTFITMHVAWKQGAAVTATIAGNSEGILKRHYRNVGVPQAEGEAYFKIMPGC